MRPADCNLCGSARKAELNRGRDLLLDRPGEYRLVRCLDCGLLYQDPMLEPRELLEHYPEDYLAYVDDSALPWLARMARGMGIRRRASALVREAPGPGRLLEVGCSTGSFLAEMRRRGWQVQGVEPNPRAAEVARRVHGLEVVTTLLEEAELPAGAFDAVALWDVFEHVFDPRATLLEIRRLLRPGGLVLLNVPNPSSLEARLFGSCWVGWDRPRHLHLYTPEVMRRYLAETGFAEVRLRWFHGRVHPTLLSLEFLFRDRGIPEARWRPWLRLLGSLPVRLLLNPVFMLGEALGLTFCMTAFAVRR